MREQLADEGVTAGATQPLAAPAPPSSSLKLAQGIQCGDYLLAFGFDWARQIVDQFDLVPIPRAPAWVLGAVNVNGVIVSVVDLANYFLGAAVPAQLQRGQRLLVGGVQAEDADGALAVVFSGTPAQLSYEPRPWADLAGLPPRLQEVCNGTASADLGQAYMDINLPKLMDALSAELSLI